LGRVHRFKQGSDNQLGVIQWILCVGQAVVRGYLLPQSGGWLAQLCRSVLFQPTQEINGAAVWRAALVGEECGDRPTGRPAG
jgi:hypothetical protein